MLGREAFIGLFLSLPTLAEGKYGKPAEAWMHPNAG